MTGPCRWPKAGIPLWRPAGIAFAESSFFPLPPDLILLPMSLAKPKKAWFYAGVCTIASVLGGMLGYYIGAALLRLRSAIVSSSSTAMGRASTVLRAFYAKWGWAFILVKGLTPIPFKLVTIVSGLLGYNFPLFVLLAAITRGARFFLARGGDEPFRRFFPRPAGKAFRRLRRRPCSRSSSAASGPPRIWSDAMTPFAAAPRTLLRPDRRACSCWRRRRSRSPAPGLFSRWASSPANCA